MNFDRPAPFEENPYRNRTLGELTSLFSESENISPEGKKAVMERVREIFDQAPTDQRNNFLETVVAKNLLEGAEEIDAASDGIASLLKTHQIPLSMVGRFLELKRSFKTQIGKVKSAIQQKPNSFEGVVDYIEKNLSEMSNLEPIQTALLEAYDSDIRPLFQKDNDKVVGQEKPEDKEKAHLEKSVSVDYSDQSSSESVLDSIATDIARRIQSEEAFFVVRHIEGLNMAQSQKEQIFKSKKVLEALKSKLKEVSKIGAYFFNSFVDEFKKIGIDVTKL